MSERRQEPADGQMFAGTPYLVLRRIGAGGMGSVHEVKHTKLGRLLVLKVLHERLIARGDLVARMKNEWNALAQLNHPNIVQVTDAGIAPSGAPFYVMERLEGETLGALLRRRGRLSPQEACAIALEVLLGLSAAHETCAVHRDIKPQNIFVLAAGGVKVLDFGIAQLRDKVERVVTAVGVSIGTPRYMAPEQAAGERVDGRADIYALGLVLYEMLVGQSPFADVRESSALVLAHLGREPVRVDWQVPSVPAELADLVQRWLAKRPESRPITAQVAHVELAALVASFPVTNGSDCDVTSGGDYEAPTLGPTPQAAPSERHVELDAPVDTLSSDPTRALEVPTPGTATRTQEPLPSLVGRSSEPPSPQSLHNPSTPPPGWAVSRRLREGRNGLWGVGAGVLGLSFLVTWFVVRAVPSSAAVAGGRTQEPRGSPLAQVVERPVAVAVAVAPAQTSASAGLPMEPPVESSAAPASAAPASAAPAPVAPAPRPPGPPASAQAAAKEQAPAGRTAVVPAESVKKQAVSAATPARRRTLPSSGL